MLNEFKLIGRVTRDAEVKTAGQTTITRFGLAVERDFKTKEGEKITDFITCQCWGKQGETLAKYAGKGSLLYVAGRIEPRNYETKAGEKVYSFQLTVEKFNFLQTKAPEGGEPVQPADMIDDAEEVSFDDDEVPF